jgi:NAD+ kinase
VNKPSSVTVLTRQIAETTADGLRRLIDAATAEGVEVRITPEEVEKHSVPEQHGVVLGADLGDPTDLAVALGGDGTILTALRVFAGTGTPVLAVNFGAIGFLATIDQTDLEDGLRRALDGELEALSLPALKIETPSGQHIAVNDVSLHRNPEGRVAELAYSVRGERLGQVRADGLVAATPAGSTGYNLANGGPVMAWGVEGVVVSFIAPHTLTARALVVAPDDVLEVENRSSSEAVAMTTDGRNVAQLAPQESARVRFAPDSTLLAQVPGATFYHRLRDKFGSLSR